MKLLTSTFLILLITLLSGCSILQTEETREITIDIPDLPNGYGKCYVLIIGKSKGKIYDYYEVGNFNRYSSKIENLEISKDIDEIQVCFYKDDTREQPKYQSNIKLTSSSDTYTLYYFYNNYSEQFLSYISINNFTQSKVTYYNDVWLDNENMLFISKVDNLCYLSKLNINNETITNLVELDNRLYKLYIYEDYIYILGGGDSDGILYIYNLESKILEKKELNNCDSSSSYIPQLEVIVRHSQRYEDNEWKSFLQVTDIHNDEIVSEIESHGSYFSISGSKVFLNYSYSDMLTIFDISKNYKGYEINEINSFDYSPIYSRHFYKEYIVLYHYKTVQLYHYLNNEFIELGTVKIDDSFLGFKVSPSGKYSLFKDSSGCLLIDNNTLKIVAKVKGAYSSTFTALSDDYLIIGEYKYEIKDLY